MVKTDYVSEATEAYRDRLDDFVKRFGTPGSDAKAAGERAAALTAAGLAWNDAVGPFLDTDGVRTILGGPSRQAVADRVRNRRLLALRTANDGGGTRLVYPLWQFDGATLNSLDEVLMAVGYDPAEPTHGWHVASWLSAPDPRLDDQRPRDLLTAGSADQVLSMAADVRHELGVDELAAVRMSAQRTA